LLDPTGATWDHAAVAVADPLLGRDAEVQRLEGLLDAVAERGSALLVLGEAGRQDVIQRLLDEAEPLTLDPVDRLRAEWRRGLLGDGVWATWRTSARWSTSPSA
jgi:hypothetical protein